MAESLQHIATEKQLDLHCASDVPPFFRKEAVMNLEDSKTCDQEAHARYFHHMLRHGFYTPPSGFEVAFISGVHLEHIDAFKSILSI